MNLRTVDPVSRSKRDTQVSPDDSAARFPPTRLSILERIRSGVPEVRREAYGALAEGYWKPIYKYLRIRWRLPREDAEDVTQGFLGTAFTKAYLDAYEPAKARFRTFLRMCLDRFVMNERKAARAKKRGGEFTLVALDFRTAEGEIRRHEPADPDDLDEVFRREFVRDLFARTVEQVRRELETAGKRAHLGLFERYDLGPAPRPTYAQLAREFGLTESQVTNYLAAARRAFRAAALDRLRALSGSEEEFRVEARELFGVHVS